ncbi:MAG: T9SS type A sorting domain-containing protein [Flavobacteriales bacterium]|jgi:uncharacterized delta-60 repeat protein|nr:T9SS type A sorting domain-containing protein [Flavobacteriales bacterium]
MRTLISTSLALAIGAAYGQPGAIDPSFDPGAGVDGSSVKDMALQPDGKILIAGWFDEYDGVIQRNLARINSDGSLDTGFDLGLLANYVDLIALRPDGKIVCTGPFGDGMARLNSDGSMDPSFDCGTGANYSIYALTLQPDGKILIGGNFTSYNGTARVGIARLNSDGDLDTSFDPGAGAPNGQFGQYGGVSSITVQADGKILIGGSFIEYDGTARIRVARLHSDGSLDTSFDPGAGAEDAVGRIALQPDGKIVIAGSFTTYNGTSRIRIARINSDGSLDTSFDPGAGADEGIYTLALQTDGKVVVGGIFEQFDGEDRDRIARLNADGSLDSSFDPGSGVSDQYSKVYILALQPDGKILIGGIFDGYDGTPRSHIARIIGGGGIGIGEVPPRTNLHVAPNPVVSSIQLIGMEGAYPWIITDTQGRLLLHGTIGVGAEQVIDASSLAAGNYVLVVSQGDARRTVGFNKL